MYVTCIHRGGYSERTREGVALFRKLQFFYIRRDPRSPPGQYSTRVGYDDAFRRILRVYDYSQ